MPGSRCKHCECLRKLVGQYIICPRQLIAIKNMMHDVSRQDKETTIRREQ